MTESIPPGKRIRGLVRLPGDKSISHRYAMIAAIAAGETEIENYSTGADCQSTLDALRALGVVTQKQDSRVTIRGRGLDGLEGPSGMLDAGNSGSTMRMLSGI